MTPLALRFAWRELRGGLRGFGVFIACIALGVMAIAGVGSVAQSLADGLARAGRVILGGDLAFSLVQREANDSERAFLGAHGTVSAVATMPTMARTGDGRTTLVEIKAVDDAYPLFGHGRDRPRHAACRRCSRGSGDAFGAAADPALLARLDLKPGDRITIGNAVLELRAALTSEPDKLAGGIGFGPRVLIERGCVARERAPAARQPGALALPAAPARRRLERRRRRRGRRNRRGRSSRMPAGTSARATRLRRSSSATSSASANSSRSSA